jgi:hypothetical protein
MLKTSLNIVILSAVLCAALVFLPLRVRIIEPQIREIGTKQIRHPFNFEALYFSFPNKIILKNPVVGNSFSCRSATFYLNPFKFLFTPLNPEKYVSVVEFEHPQIDIIRLKNLSAGTRHPATPLKPGSMDIYLRDAQVFYDGVSLINGFSGELLYRPGTAESEILLRSDSFDTSIKITSPKVGQDKYIFSGLAKISHNMLNGLADITASYSAADGSFEADISIPKLDMAGLSFSNSTLKISANKTLTMVNCTTNAGNIAYSSTLTGRKLAADLDLLKLNNKLKGSVSIDLSTGQNFAAGHIDISGMSYNGIRISDIRNVVKESSNGDLFVTSTFNGTTLKAETIISGKKNVACNVNDRNKVVGRIEGSLLPMDIRVDINSVKYDDLIKSYANGFTATGLVGLKGTINADVTNMDLYLNKLKYTGGTENNYIVRFIRKKGLMGLMAKAFNDEWKIEYYGIDENTWFIKSRFNQFNVRENLRKLGIQDNVDCHLDGNVSYNSNGSLDCDLNLNNLNWNKIHNGSGRFLFKYSDGKVDIKSASVKSDTGYFSITGGTRTASGSEVSEFDLKFSNFSVKDFLFDGLVRLNLETSRHGSKNAFYGSVNSDDLNIGNSARGKLSSKLYISDGNLNIYDIVYANYVRGKLHINFPRDDAYGLIKLNKFPVKFITDTFSGNFTGSLKLSGPSLTPNLELEGSIPDASYQSTMFSCNGVLLIKNGKYYLKNMELRKDTSSISVIGEVWPLLGLKIDYKALDLPLIDHLFGTDHKLSGRINGYIFANGYLGTPKLNIQASGTDLKLNGKKLDSLEAKFKYENNQLTAENSLIKYSDSELKISNGSAVDFKKKDFDIKIELNNYKIGTMEIFGKLNAKGGWKLVKERLSISSTVKANKVWLNQFNLGDVFLNIDYFNGIITFHPRLKSPVTVEGKIDAGSPGIIRFENISFSNRGDMRVSAGGYVSKKDFELDFNGNGMEASALADILGLGFGIEGKTNLRLVCKGNPDNPLLKATLDISRGELSGIPFDSASVRAENEKDYVVIENLKITRDKAYLITGKGKFPFSFSRNNFINVSDKPVLFEAKLENGSLAILPEITDFFKSAKGRVDSYLKIKGSTKKPEILATLIVKDADIGLSRYVSRLKNLTVNLEMKNNVLKINRFDAKAGKSVLKIEGNVLFDKFMPKTLNITCKTQGNKGISIVVPELPIPSALFKSQKIDLLKNNSTGEPRFDIKLTGPANKPTISGWALLDNTHFTYPSLIPSGNDDKMEGIIDKVTWNLELKAGENTWYENELVDVNVQGGIQLTGKGAYPTVDGKVEALRGSISYVGTDFKIKSANLDIVKNDVYLQGEGECEIYDQDSNDYDTVTLQIDRAKLAEIKPRFISKNNSLLASDKTMQKAAGIQSLDSDSTNNVRRQLVRFFDSTLATPLAKTLLIKSGLADSFKVNYSNSYANNSQSPIPIPSPDTDPSSMANVLAGTKYSLEKYLTDRVLLGYSVTFDNFQNKLDLRHELELSYRWTKNLFIKGYYGLDTNNPMGEYDKKITFERQWKFGLPSFSKSSNDKASRQQKHQQTSDPKEGN